MIPIPDVRFDESGLLPAVIQHALTGEVLTVAYMNEESLRRTCATGETWLWSRSRRELWHKGATSGNTQAVVAVVPDCDADAVVVRVHPRGPACHLGTRACFAGAAPMLLALEDRLRERAVEKPDGSYTAALLADENKRLKKLGEEATELALACVKGSDDEVAGEAADVLYHVMVALLGRGLSLTDAVAVLDARHTADR